MSHQATAQNHHDRRTIVCGGEVKHEGVDIGHKGVEDAGCGHHPVGLVAGLRIPGDANVTMECLAGFGGAGGAAQVGLRRHRKPFVPESERVEAAARAARRLFHSVEPSKRPFFSPLLVFPTNGVMVPEGDRRKIRKWIGCKRRVYRLGYLFIFPT